MTFTALNDKQKKQIEKHKKKHGTRSANVFRAHLMRGKSKKEAEKLAAERTPNLPSRRPSSGWGESSQLVSICQCALAGLTSP